MNDYVVKADVVFFIRNEAEEPTVYGSAVEEAAADSRRRFAREICQLIGVMYDTSKDTE